MIDVKKKIYDVSTNMNDVNDNFEQGDNFNIPTNDIIRIKSYNTYERNIRKYDYDVEIDICLSNSIGDERDTEAFKRDFLDFLTDWNIGRIHQRLEDREI